MRHNFRYEHITIAIACMIFGILNIVGSAKFTRTDISYKPEDCVANLCTVTRALSSKGTTYVYINYDFLLTSYFIFAKGSSYLDVFKISDYSTDTSDCYPVSTYADYDSVMKKLGLTYTNPKIIKGVAANHGKDKISPCGLKSALYDYIGSLNFYYANDSSLVAFNTKDVIHSKFYSYLKSADSDYTDVTQGRFFNWYLPQVPAFGTRLLWSIADNGLNGEFKIVFDKSKIV